MFSSDMVPFTRNCPEERMVIKGLCWPLASVAGVSLTSFDHALHLAVDLRVLRESSSLSISCCLVSRCIPAVLICSSTAWICTV